MYLLPVVFTRTHTMSSASIVGLHAMPCHAIREKSMVREKRRRCFIVGWQRAKESGAVQSTISQLSTIMYCWRKYMSQQRGRACPPAVLVPQSSRSIILSVVDCHHSHYSNPFPFAGLPSARSFLISELFPGGGVFKDLQQDEDAERCSSH